MRRRTFLTLTGASLLASVTPGVERLAVAQAGGLASEGGAERVVAASVADSESLTVAAMVRYRGAADPVEHFVSVSTGWWVT